MLQRGELPVIERPQQPVRLPQIGPSIEFPMFRLPLRDATSASPPGALFGPDGKTPGDDLDAGKPGVDYRWEHIVTVWDAQGNLIEDWTQWDKMFRRPHAVYISPYDPEKNVWIVDDYRHAIFKFSHDGKKLLQTIGEPNVPGTDDKHFYRPDVHGVAAGRHVLRRRRVSEHARREVRQERQVPDDVGAARARRPRSAPATSTTSTASPSIRRRVACSSTIAATAACRCSTRTGSISTSGASGPRGISDIHMFIITSDRFLWAADRGTSKMLKYGLDGNFLYSWGMWGEFPGGFWGVHGMSVDQEGNVYTAAVDSGGAQKFTPRKGANPAFLLGKQVNPGWK